jgi:membrane-associated protein
MTLTTAAVPGLYCAAALVVLAPSELVAAYAAIGLLVAGDAVIPMLPGETAIQAGGILAAVGNLQLAVVILAGAAGTVLGDSMAFAVGRAGRGHAYGLLTRLAGEERLARARETFLRHGGAFVIAGRYVPVGRLVVNLTAGALMPYRRFLPLSVVAGTLWSSQAAIVAYLLGALLEVPLLAFGASVAWSALLLAVVLGFNRLRQR